MPRPKGSKQHQPVDSRTILSCNSRPLFWSWLGNSGPTREMIASTDDDDDDTWFASFCCCVFFGQATTKQKGCNECVYFKEERPSNWKICLYRFFGVCLVFFPIIIIIIIKVIIIVSIIIIIHGPVSRYNKDRFLAAPQSYFFSTYNKRRLIWYIDRIYKYIYLYTSIV